MHELLNPVFGHLTQEKHELEEQRQQLIEEVSRYRRKIKQLEDDLLFRLSNSQVGWRSRAAV